MEKNEQNGLEQAQNSTEIQHYDIGIAKQMGSFNDASGVGSGYRWLYTSGMPGLSINGEVPDGIKAQSELAWQSIISLLKAADMGVENIVKITQYLTNTKDIPEYSMTRKSFLGDTKTVSTLLIVAELGWPNMLVEVEIIAAKKA
ncbi:MAG: RidA family protein [Mucilaginibacter sp.]|uniref:RidA family protein n=1 Tax=Mucilaginibacter sp. TaxID=1882438 RepID=UPI0034E4A6CC